MALSRDTLIEATVIGGTAGLFAAGVNIAARYTTDPGDILGFLGGAIGAGAAVIGAVWLERRKAAEAARERIDAMGRMLVGLAQRAANIRTADEARQRAAIRTLRQAMNTFAALRSTGALNDTEAQALLDAFAERTDEIRGMLIEAEARIDKREISAADAVAQFQYLLARYIKSIAIVLCAPRGDWPIACKRAAKLLADLHDL